MNKKSAIFFGIAAIILVSAVLMMCNNKSGSSSYSGRLEPRQDKVVAIYINPDSTRRLEVMYRAIVKGIDYDSIKKKDYILYDTIWGRPVSFQAKDSLNKPMVDSLGKPVYTIRYIYIRKDSVIWDIAGKSLDSLLRKQ